MHRAAEVAQDHVAVADDPIARIVVRARSVRTAGDDREVGALVAGVEHALDDLAVEVVLGTPGKRACAHHDGDLVDRGRGGLERVDLGGVLDRTQRSGNGVGGRERASGSSAWSASTNRAQV